MNSSNVVKIAVSTGHVRRLLSCLGLQVATLIGLECQSLAQWAPPPPYDQLIRLVEDPTGSRTGGDIAIAIHDGLQPTIIYFPAAASRLNATFPGAGHFYFVHEYGHHILGSSDERMVDCWAASQLADAPNGQQYLQAAIAHFEARGMEYHPRYGTMIERAARIRNCAQQKASIGKEASVGLVIWEKTPGNTGFRADVHIDGKKVGTITNLEQPQRLGLGSLSIGVHRYELRNCTGYRIGSGGEVGGPLGSGLTCAGSFAVMGRQTFHLGAILGATGLVCRFEPGPVEVEPEEPSKSRNRPGRETVEVELWVWEPSPGPTGVTALLYVDGKEAGEIDNLSGAHSLVLDLTVGRHTYEIRNITGYNLDGFGNVLSSFLSSGQCSGRLEIAAKKKYGLTMRYEAGALSCAIRSQ